MMRTGPMTITLLAAAILCACQHGPTISYPKMAEAGALEASFACEALDDAILKADAVRWSIRTDGGRLLTADERAGRRVANVAANVAAASLCTLCFLPLDLGAEAHAALDHADRRLASLLALKKAKACAARPTAVVSTTDLELHDALAMLLAGEASQGAFAERTRLLDGLRP